MYGQRAKQHPRGPDSFWWLLTQHWPRRRCLWVGGWLRRVVGDDADGSRGRLCLSLGRDLGLFGQICDSARIGSAVPAAQEQYRANPRPSAGHALARHLVDRMAVRGRLLLGDGGRHRHLGVGGRADGRGFPLCVRTDMGGSNFPRHVGFAVARAIRRLGENGRCAGGDLQLGRRRLGARTARHELRNQQRANRLGLPLCHASRRRICGPCGDGIGRRDRSRAFHVSLLDRGKRLPGFRRAKRR